MDTLLLRRPLRRLLGALLGGWLLLNGAGFGPTPLFAQAPPALNRVEFFLDTDPGFGLATAVTLPGAPSDTRLNLPVAVPIGGLAPGFHNLFIRSRDVNDDWSQTLRRLFFVDDNAGLTAPNLAEVEHFLDTDPGHGNGTSTALTGTTVNNRTIVVPIGALAPGFHRLFMRTRDVSNQWSQTNARLFFVDDNASLTAPNLAEVEHFIDTDPGHGNGISTSLTGTSVSNRAIPVAIGALAPGFHRLFMRTRDVSNQWSQTFARLFFVDDLSALTAPNLTRAEFFFDTDPGFGSGTTIPLGTPATSYTGVAFAADATALADGPHRLFVRVRDATNRWSLVLNRRFTRSGCAAAENLAEGLPAANYVGNCVGAAPAEAAFNGTGAAGFTNSCFIGADFGAATPRTVSEAQISLRNPNGTVVSGTLALETSTNGTSFTTAGSVAVSLAASQTTPQRIVLPLPTAVANVRAVRLTLTLPSIGTPIQATEAGVFFFNCVAPAITSFSPTSGPVGTSVTITGTNLSGASGVSFNGTAATVLNAVNATTVTATVPAGATTGVISLTTPNGTAVSATSFTVSQPLPTITSFSPTTGIVGTSVVLTGTALGTASAVRFNGVNAPGFVVNSGTQITVSVPSGATTGPVSVSTTGGTGTSSTNFTVIQPPTVASFSPISGLVGTSVTITGTNLTGATAIRFNGTAAATFSVTNATTATATVPTGATTGPVSVTTVAGTGSSAANFTVTLPPPTISSFSPTSGPVGTGVTISGTNLSGITGVSFNGTATTVFSGGNGTSTTATVPTGATTGAISLTTASGTATSSASFTVTAAPPPAPTVTGFSPTSGPVGTSVSLSGTNFTGATAVGFNGLAALTFNVSSATSATATVPAGAGSGPVSVTTTGGTGTSAAIFTVTVAPPPAPTITSFSPTSGPTGTSVTISGANLAGITAVSFNGTAATVFASGSGTSATATVPVGATTGAISLTTPGGTATSAATFTVTVPSTAPTITSFAPTSGPVGTAVIISGTNFTGTTAVTFNGTAAPGFTVNSATQIAATVPVGATTGLVRVTTPAGTAFSATDFTVTTPPPPGDLTFLPAAGSPGSVVLVTKVNGADFTTASSARFNGAAATGTVFNSATQLTATVPFGATTGPLTTVTGATTLSGASFTVTGGAAPSVRNFSPLRAPVGAVVAVFGANFSGVTQVRFGSIPAPGFTVVSPTELTVPVPTGAATGQRIFVVAAGGMAQSMRSFTLISPPTLTALTPTFGTAGSMVVLTGTHLTNTTSVTFGGGVDAVEFTVDSPTQLTATIPAGAASGPVSATTVAGTGTTTASLTIGAGPAPVISSFSPTSGPVGQTVALTGTGLSGATSVRFNGTEAVGFAVNSATQITCSVPSGATSGRLSVLTARGFTRSATAFRVTPVATGPVITSLTPTAGSPGALVLIAGIRLSGATQVRFGGNVPAASFTVNSASEIAAVVPVGAVTGVLNITTPNGSASSGTFSITAPPAPSVLSFSPGTGPVGTVVTVTGANFSGVTGVRLGQTNVPAFTVASATSLNFTVPAGAVTSRIRVFAAGGLQQSATDFVVIPAPTITAFSPVSGSPGSQVLLTGTHLTGATTVRFGGISTAVFSVVSATSLLATVPVGAVSGVLSVTTPGGTATSAGSFTVTVPPPPTITALAPASGLIGSVVLISGTNLLGTSSVRVNGTAVESFIVSSATQVAAQVPNGARTGRISLTTSGGQAVSPTDFTVLSPPDIDALTPIRGPVGTVVTVVGSDLGGATAIRFGGTAASTFSAAPDGKTAIATVPGGALTGPVSLTTAIATAVSAQVFTLTLMRPGGVGWVPTEPVQLVPYPNPAGNGQRLTVQVLHRPAAQGSADVYLLDALGRRVRTVPLDVARNEAIFELNGLSPGVYFVRCGTAAQAVLLDR